MRAITLSNDGQTIAVSVITITTAIRTAALARPRLSADMPVTFWVPRPARCSIVVRIGRELFLLAYAGCNISAYFNGNLVIGIIAMQAAIMIDNVLGYPSVRKIF